ncbi:MAG: ABC transporter permease [Desulfobulbaceae bacterium]|uniref:ABC transporter permease n=1 Tax=Candidatus Desulfobia pelagia TaxID=2841692 RepID=A0A8J6TGU2_9BACT|nr:ABC transporter permease [Candidatus Desulfobia pelagia]
MRTGDVIIFAFRALNGARVRTILMLIAMSIGVASVVVLTSLGEGARSFVIGEFASLGSNLLVVLPGRSETTGGPPPLLGATPRDLTLEDAMSLSRSYAVRDIAPVTIGSAPVSWQQRERDVPVLGSTANLYSIRHLHMSKGRFLSGDPFQAFPATVLGADLAKELFGAVSPVGEWIRIGGSRFRVIGVLAPKGVSLGMDMADVAIIPAASAHVLFNSTSLFRIVVEARDRDSLKYAEQDILKIIRERHDGEDDITVITQDAVLATFDKIFRALTLTVASIAAISLVVAGILIMNVMLVAVSQRTAEIGLLKALGATPSQILILFLSEAFFLSLAGAFSGLGIGLLCNWVVHQVYTDFPVSLPLWAMPAAFGVAIGAGLLFSIMPARRAAQLQPVVALSRRA